MDGLTQAAANAAHAGEKIGPDRAASQHVSEFEQMMRDAGAAGQTPDRYVNGTESPSKWLSDAVLRAGEDVSNTFRKNVQSINLQMETLDPTDPMMLPRLAQLQMEMHNAAFQLQFTTSLVHLANNGVKTLFHLQG